LGTLVIHTAPNQWLYRYEHPRQQKAAIEAGFWLPPTRRTWYERLMHINEQNPRVLKGQLLKHFPHVLIWFTDGTSMGGSLLRRFSIRELRSATSLFAVASHRPIDLRRIAAVFSIPPLPEEEAQNISLRVADCPDSVKPEEEFLVSVLLTQPGPTWLTSYGYQPMHLSYHWMDRHRRVEVFDGLRTALHPPARAAGETGYAVRVKAPKEPGKHLLRILPVQEGVRWHDGANRDSVPIKVVDSPLVDRVFGYLPTLDNQRNRQRLLHKGRSRPIMLIVETVNICNNSCLVCAYDHMTRRKQFMDMDLFAKVLKDYRNMGGGALSLTPVVGDVLLDKHLLVRLALIEPHSRHIRPVSVTTNLIAADHYDDHELSRLLLSFDRVNVSIYGLSTDEYLGLSRKDNYGKLLHAISRVRNLGLASKLHLGFRFLRQHTDEQIKEWMINNLGVLVPYSSTAMFANWSILDTRKSLPLDATWVVSSEKKEPCLIPLVAMQVFSNGKVSFCPCDDFDNSPSLDLGSVLRMSLTDLYNQQKVKELWDFYPPPLFCANCSFYMPISDLAKKPWIFEEPLNFIGG
jgi:MoaA/NifB/PqqE/SkfB family radical SAM enzyme